MENKEVKMVAPEDLDDNVLDGVSAGQKTGIPSNEIIIPCIKCNKYCSVSPAVDARNYVCANCRGFKSIYFMDI